MPSRPRVVALVLLLLPGCSPPPPAPPPVAFITVLDTKQVMQRVIDPAADVIWDAVKSVSTQTETKDISPQTDEQWNAVRDAAATLTEAANMLLIEGRARDRKDWPRAARLLVKTAERAMRAAEAKNKGEVFAVGGDIYEACRGCHIQYAKHLVSSIAGER